MVVAEERLGGEGALPRGQGACGICWEWVGGVGAAGGVAQGAGGGDDKGCFGCSGWVPDPGAAEGGGVVGNDICVGGRAVVSPRYARKELLAVVTESRKGDCQVSRGEGLSGSWL